jgi:8-oxo-dGTP pyrophosphatase MutT (NUDIX family)
MIITNYCNQKCCSITTTNRYIRRQYYQNKSRRKAGAFIYDSESGRILLIQSRHQKWGLPKGSVEDSDEDIPDTAIREVKEETGIIIPREKIVSATTHRVYRCHYYYIEMPVQQISLSDSDTNDATGITWVKPECLIQLVRSGTLAINSHFRFVFKEVFKITI